MGGFSDDMTADQVFDIFDEQKLEIIDAITDDVSGFVKEMYRLIGKDTMCMSGIKTRRVFSTNIRCRACEYMSRLVDEDKRQVGEPFTIEYGDRKDRRYVIERYSPGDIAVQNAVKSNGVVHVKLNSFEHSVVVNYLLDSITDTNTVITAYVCGTSGYIVRPFADFDSNVKISPSTVMVDFCRYLHSLYRHQFVHSNIGRNTLVFDDRTGELTVTVNNLLNASITYPTKRGHIRFIPPGVTHSMTWSDSVSEEPFTLHDRIIELINSSKIPPAMGAVYTAYALITCFLLTGRWYRYTEMYRPSINTLFGEMGMSRVVKYLQRSRESPDTEDINDILRFVPMSKKNIELFFDTFERIGTLGDEVQDALEKGRF
jgi:hypothetical protein